MAKTIKRLPTHLKEISIRVADDLASSDPAARARVNALRMGMKQHDDFFILENACAGIGPQKMKEMWGGTHETWRHRIRQAFEQAASFYGIAKEREFSGSDFLSTQGFEINERGECVRVGKNA